MSSAGLFHRWRRGAEPPLTAEIADQDLTEIDEELMFHFRALVDEELAKGVPSDTAWRAAQDRFGSLPHYAKVCGDIHLEDQIMWQRLSIAGFVVLGLLVGWLALEVRTLAQGQASLVQANQAKLAVVERTAEKPAEQRHAITGQILDEKDQPIAGAKVLVILKTWPNDRYRQDHYSTTSDDRGRFRLPNLVPSQGQYAILLSALKSGYALTSNYHLQPAGNHRSVDPVTLRCERASPVTLLVRDEQGQPAARAGVVPSSRQSPDGTSHLIYFQGNEPVRTAADAEGKVELACFQRGDTAEVYLLLPGKDWQSYSFAIPKDGDTVEVSATGAAKGDESPGAGTKS